MVTNEERKAPMISPPLVLAPLILARLSRCMIIAVNAIFQKWCLWVSFLYFEPLFCRCSQEDFPVKKWGRDYEKQRKIRETSSKQTNESEW